MRHPWLPGGVDSSAREKDSQSILNWSRMASRARDPLVKHCRVRVPPSGLPKTWPLPAGSVSGEVLGDWVAGLAANKVSEVPRLITT